MPTNQKRHTCVICGAKRVEKYLKVANIRKFSNIVMYQCDTSKLSFIINGNVNCSKRTPLETNKLKNQ